MANVCCQVRVELTISLGHGPFMCLTSNVKQTYKRNREKCTVNSGCVAQNEKLSKPTRFVNEI